MIMQQIITQVKIAQWLKLLTSIHFVYGREFESQTGKKIFFFFFFLFFFFFFFLLLLLACFIFLFVFFQIRCARFAWSSNFSGFSVSSNKIVLPKMHAVNSLSIRLS